jgi:hypothetical protein
MRERGSEEEDGEEGEREAVRKRMERKGEKGTFPSSSSLPLSLLLLHPPPHYLSPSFFLFSTFLPPCSPLLTTSLPSSSPSFLSVILTTSLPSSSPSYSLPLSLLLLLYFSPSLLSSSYYLSLRER